MSGFHEDGGSDKLQRLNMDINSRVVQLEELGQRGEVEGAQVLLREVEALERERERERAGLVRDSSKVRAFFHPRYVLHYTQSNVIICTSAL